MVQLTRLRTNEDKLVCISAQGVIAPPRTYGTEVSHDGKPFELPGLGGIVLQPRIGDRVMGWQGDHIEPGVSARFGIDPKARENQTFNFLCCAGNVATVLTGAAKGKKGWVIGHHGGVDNVIIDFSLSVLEKLTYDDKILVRAVGQGLKLLDAPAVTTMNIDPSLLARVVRRVRDGVTTVPVTVVVPAEMMGSGLGSTTARTGDYDIMTADEELVKKYELEKLRFGDVIGIQDHAAEWGWALRRGARTVAIVIHSDSFLAGHGPGTTTILTSVTGKIEFEISDQANVGFHLKTGKFGRL